MKSKYVCIILFFMIAACRKESVKLKSDLKGTWELASINGAWTGYHEYAPGNGNIYTFNENTYSQVIKTADSTYEFSGTFVIYKDKPCDFAEEQYLINFNGESYADKFSLSGDKLVLGTTECIADGWTGTYRKIR